MTHGTKSQREFLTTKEVAALLRLSPRTLEGMRRNGKGPVFTRMGEDQNSKVAYRRSDLKRWLADNSRRQVTPRKMPANGSPPPAAAIERAVPRTHLTFPAEPPTECDADKSWIATWLEQIEKLHRI